MESLLHSEIFRLSRWQMPRILLAILAVITVALYFILWATVQMPQSGQAGNLADLKDSLRVGSVLEMGLALVHQIGTVLLVILAATTIAAEFAGGTIRTVLPRARSRADFLSAKLLGLLLATIVLVCVGFLAAWGSSAVITAIGGLNPALTSDFALRVIASLGRTVLAMLPYLALAFLIALVTRSGGAGIGFGLGFYFLESVAVSILVNTPLKGILPAFPATNVASLLQANAVKPATSVIPLVDPWQAAGVLVLYTIGFLALAYWHFNTRDITVSSAG